jgi:hypothetical protein
MTIQEQIAEVEREIGLREKLYPAWIASRGMNPSKAEHQLNCMKAVLATLESLAPKKPQV